MQTATFELASTAARARVVAPYLGPFFDLRSTQSLHELLGRLSGAPQGRQLLQIRAAVGEKVFIPGT